MFIRLKIGARPHLCYAALVENRREGKKVRQKFLGYLCAFDLSRSRDQEYVRGVLEQAARKLVMEFGVPQSRATPMLRGMLKKLLERKRSLLSSFAEASQL